MIWIKLFKTNYQIVNIKKAATYYKNLIKYGENRDAVTFFFKKKS